MITSPSLLRTLCAPLAAIAFAGCASEMSAVSIEGFEFIDVKDNFCMPSGTSLVQGELDSALGTGYIVAVTVKNDLPDNADEAADRLNSNTVNLDTVEVTYRTSKDATFQPPAPETLPVSIIAKAGSEAKAAMHVLSAANGAVLANADGGFLIVEVRLTGKTADGAAITSNTAQFPVKVCTNCIKPCRSGEEVVFACSPGQADGSVCAPIADAE